MKRYLVASKDAPVSSQNLRQLANGPVPAPFDEFYEKVSPKQLADGLGCAVGKLPEVIYESDYDQVSVVQAAGVRVYPISIDQVRSLAEQ